ncbi:MAG: hypothetical protein CL489_16665 [Acidobacteria bacterium]|nr:hypothetical protein [Acidobacteriota bacterium]
MAYENPGDEYGTRQPAGSKPPSDSYQIEGLEETEREMRRRLYGDEFHADWERDEYGNLREGGLVRRRYQGGGIASLLEGGMPGAVAGAGIPGGGITETFQEEISPVGAADPTMESNLTPEQSYLLKVFSEARDALMGEHPQPEVAISEFVEVFGSEALDKLRRELSAGGEEAGEFGETRGFGRGTESDGLSDSIAGNIDGQEEIAVGEGEVVIPAWAVAAAGNGSSDSGARRWMAMVDEMGEARGAPGQPTQVAGVDIEEIMRRRARA